MDNDSIQGSEQGTYVELERLLRVNAGLPTGRESYGNGALIVV